MYHQSSTDPERSARIALGVLAEPGNRELARLVRTCGAPQAFAQAVTATGVRRVLAGTVRDRLAATGAGGSLAPQQLAAALAGRAVAQAQQLGARIITAVDAEWPQPLDDLTAARPDVAGADDGAPLCLWLRGPLPLAGTLRQSVAVVGARAATSYGTEVATEFGYQLAGRGWTVVSGGGFGVDGSAHRGALAAGGPTVVVLAAGIDRAYPAGNAALLAQIGAEGLLVTEWAPGTAPARNRVRHSTRLLAAATRGTVLVEAITRSTARDVLGWARLLRRPAMAVPGPITSAMSAGTHLELRRPGTILVTGIEEILQAVGDDPAGAAVSGRAALDVLDPVRRRILDAVPTASAVTAAQIVDASGVSDRDARRHLPLLVELGLVVAAPDGYRRTAGTGGDQPQR